MSTLKLENLEAALTSWEHMNLMAQVSEKTVLISLENKYKVKFPEISNDALIGSEISSSGMIVKPIENYKNFRKDLENSKSEIDYQKYLPRVPKDLRELIGPTKELFVLTKYFCREILSFPMFLSEWMKSKRVITLNKNVKIEKKLLTTEQNYLDKLPYDQFILRSPQSFSLKFGRTTIQSSEVMIIKKSGLINMLFFSDTFLEAHNKGKDGASESLKSFNDFLKMDKKHSARWAQNFINSPFPEIKYPNPMIMTFSETGDLIYFTKEGIKIIEPIENDRIINLGESYKSHVDFISFFNGFLYTLANASPEEEIVYDIIEEELPKEENSTNEKLVTESVESETIKLDWNEISNSSIVHLSVKKVNGEKKFVKSSGIEKAPHLRRKHYHTFHTKNGPIKKVVEQLIVRKDKLKEKGLSGGVIELKK